MLRIILTSSGDKSERRASIELLKCEVASYLYSCIDWEYEYHIFHDSLFITTDFGISKSLDFISVLRDICRRSDNLFINKLDYDISL